MVLIPPKEKKILPGKKISFRPLTGIMVLISCGHEGTIEVFGKAVSVPLRGLWFLSTYEVSRKDILKVLFPSPYGDYGSYQNYNYQGWNEVFSWFPSPYGDYGSYRLRQIVRDLRPQIRFPSPYGDYGSYH